MRLIISEENGGFNLSLLNVLLQNLEHTNRGIIIAIRIQATNTTMPCKNKRENTDIKRLAYFCSRQFSRVLLFWKFLNRYSDILLLFLYRNNAGRHKTEQKFYLNNRKSFTGFQDRIKYKDTHIQRETLIRQRAKVCFEYEESRKIALILYYPLHRNYISIIYYEI